MFNTYYLVSKSSLVLGGILEYLVQNICFFLLHYFKICSYFMLLLRVFSSLKCFLAKWNKFLFSYSSSNNPVYRVSLILKSLGDKSFF